MSLRSVDSAEDNSLKDYLEFIFEGTEGYAYVPSKAYLGGDKPRWTQKFFSWPAEKNGLITYVLEMTNREEVYVSPSLFSSDSALKESLLGSWVVWVEMDGNLPETMEEVPDPSFKVRTSDNGHEHWYWKLTEFADPKQVEQINRALSYRLHADTSGWDANQVLRPPNTLNHKRDRQVKRIHQNDFKFDLARFATVPEPPVATQLYTEADAVGIPWIIAKYEWPKDAFELLQDRNVEQGERSTKLMQLGYYCAEIGLTDKEIYSILLSADKWWGKFHDRPDRDQRLNDIIVRARIKHPMGATLIQIAQLPVMGGYDLFQSEVKIEWAIEEFLEDNGCMVLAAKPGIGKTRISIQAAINLAMGVPFLKYNIPESRKVGFFSLEMHQAGLQYFYNAMTSKFDKEVHMQLQENLKFVPIGTSFNVLDLANSKLVQAFIEENELEIIFFDTLGRTTTKSLNSDDDVKTIFDWDSALRKRFDIATWYIHHNRKATAQNKQPKTQDDVYGSVYIAGSATDVYALWAKETTNSNIQLINLKHRYSRQEAAYYLNSNNDLTFSIKPVVEFTNTNSVGLEETNDDTQTRVLDIERSQDPEPQESGDIDF